MCYKYTQIYNCDHLSQMKRMFVFCFQKTRKNGIQHLLLKFVIFKEIINDINNTNLYDKQNI